MHLRHLLAGSALAALVSGGALLSPASATVTASCDDPAALTAAITQAQADLTQARVDLKAANRPLGRLVAAKRHEARAELATSRVALRALRKQLAHTKSPADRAALRQQIHGERRDVSHARSLLELKRAVLTEIKADRAAARAEVTAATTSLAELTALQETCPTAP
jgi:uncharacterized protein involved in outer membrane biogenesis